MIPGFPILRNAGADGLLVSFGPALSEPANRAAIAFRAAIEGAGWDGVAETSSTLVSAYLRMTPKADPDALEDRLSRLMASRDWFAEPLPAGRRLHRIPTVYGTDLAPQLDEAAGLAGCDADAAIAVLSSARLRVTALGFAPGQPYLGELPAAWDIPRQQGLTPTVPTGALVLAIRQMVLFATRAPTGWRHVGQTAAPLFRPGHDRPFLLRPGDEVVFPAVPRNRFDDLQGDPDGGCTWEPL
ncbi:allophanate hydrolase subunit 1 [Thalassococcus sp. CAU 1522]|uniref:Allophanate hydrolase subunit 1 n=1 Tax=Thalassococcus arenae TaxID=2851652 RepID=A0ABS6N8Q1_9RHOB|nr:carboxyltransferase domain-containing protein [Thalassococcus arenae]MBV2360395.1 allophanate hydrolase subunit 1 [Thalassococcus arenae]